MKWLYLVLLPVATAFGQQTEHTIANTSKKEVHYGASPVIVNTYCIDMVLPHRTVYLDSIVLDGMVLVFEDQTRLKVNGDLQIQIRNERRTDIPQELTDHTAVNIQQKSDMLELAVASAKFLPNDFDDDTAIQIYARYKRRKPLLIEHSEWDEDRKVLLP